MLQENDLVDFRYQILSLVSEDSLFTIYRGYDTVDDINVCIRILHRANRFSSQSVAEMFTRLRTLQKINHPNIEHILDFGTLNDQIYIVSDLPEKARPIEPLAQSELKFRTYAGILAQLADALAELHDMGLIHGQISPKVIYIQGDTQAILGVVHFTDIIFREEREKLTEDWIGINSIEPAYTAPEISLGKTNDKAADIYSLGAVCYEMITGVPVYQSAIKFGAALMSITHVPVIRYLKSHKTPRPFYRILVKALSPKPQDRFRDAKIFAKVLHKYADGKRPHIALTRQQKKVLPRFDPKPVLLLLITVFLIPAVTFLSMKNQGKEPAIELGLAPSYTPVPPTSTPTPTSSPTATITPTITLIPTRTNTPYYTPTLSYPLKPNTPMPPVAIPIYRGNLSGISLLVDINSQEITRANAISISPDGQYIAAVNERKSLLIWDIQANKGQSVMIKDVIPEMVFSPQSDYIAVARLPKTYTQFDIKLAVGQVSVYAVNSLKEAKVFSGYPGLGQIGYSQDGSMLIGGTGDQILVWDILSGQPIKISTGTFAGCRVAYSAVGAQYLGSVSNNSTFNTWDTGDQMACSQAGDNLPDYFTVDHLKFINYNSNRIEAKNTKTSEFLWTYPVLNVTSIFITHDNQWVLVGTSTGDVMILDMSNGKRVHLIKTGAAVMNVASSNDMKYIIVNTGTNGIKIYGVRSY